MIATRTAGPVCLLVVPRFHDEDRWCPGPELTWLTDCLKSGDEPVLHGCTHLAGDGSGEREFARLDFVAARRRVSTGLHVLRQAGVSPRGFIAPCYAHDPAIGAACTAEGIEWWANRTFLAGDRARLLLPSLGAGASTGIRRAVSGLAVRAACEAVRRIPSIRLDLHPADLRHPRLRAVGEWALSSLIGQGRTPCTHDDLIRGATGCGATVARSLPTGGDVAFAA